ncbi:copper amine oxidase N-terminal domain-containing protein, partial [Paenibacillus sp. HN-1]
WLLTLDDGGVFDSNDGSVSPIVSKGVTLLPIAPIVDRLGGKVEWSGSEHKITIKLDSQTLELWIDQKKALVKGEERILTVAPTVVKGRTMIPVRFVTENLGAIVRWDQASKIVMIYYGGAKEQETDLF